MFSSVHVDPDSTWSGRFLGIFSKLILEAVMPTFIRKKVINICGTKLEVHKRLSNFVKII